MPTPTGIRKANPNSDSNLDSHPKDIQSQIYALADSLGVKPADLSAAIRPLTDPTAPNPAEEMARLKGKVEEVGSSTKEKEKEEAPGGMGVLSFVEEAFMD